ncbi:MAG: hypothetical protein J6P14_03240 [Ruminococcus sp.]|nr:hypothetical protein [Ruminococcus sp.]
MKANNRIKTEFIINTIISSILFIIGVLSIIGGTIAFSEIANETQDITNNALSLIFLGPFVLGIYIIVTIIIVLIGFIPLFTGLITGSLTYLARFRFSENGTVVTKGYKILMTTVYVVHGVVIGTYGTGIFSAVLEFISKN